jgi:hypothetical protein
MSRKDALQPDPAESQDRRIKQQGLQGPRALVDTFRVAASTMGPGGVKVLGTAAMALILGAPDSARDALCREVASRMWGPGDPDSVTPELGWEVFSAQLVELAGKKPQLDGEDSSRYVLRLVGELRSRWSDWPKRTG